MEIPAKSALHLGAQSRHGKLAGIVSLVVSLLLFGTVLAASSASEAPEKKAARGTMTFAPKSLAFGQVEAGTSSQMSVNLTNTSAVAIDITKITTTGAGFSAAKTCLGILAATGCKVVVTFAPAVTKSAKTTEVTGTLTIQDNASNSPQKVSLSGTKFGPFTALTARMTTARGGHTATLLPDGKVLITGGCNKLPCPTALRTAELYDPVANAFTALTATMTSGRFGHTAGLLPDGQVLLTGGYSELGTGAISTPLDTAEVYDPVANTFRALIATMTTVRAWHTATVLPDGTVLLTGGHINNDDTNPLNSAEVYDPAAQTFTALTATMTTDRAGHTATLLPNGQVLLTGGTDTYHDGPPLNTAEAYDPVANTFTALTARMTSVRHFHRAALLPNGQVLLTGGATYGTSVSKTLASALKTAEVYGPVANAFTALTAAMTIPRVGHTATPLPNGQVLLTGGFTNNSSDTALDTAEVYDP